MELIYDGTHCDALPTRNRHHCPFAIDSIQKTIPIAQIFIYAHCSISYLSKRNDLNGFSFSSAVFIRAGYLLRVLWPIYSTKWFDKEICLRVHIMEWMETIQYRTEKKKNEHQQQQFDCIESTHPELPQLMFNSAQ